MPFESTKPQKLTHKKEAVNLTDQPALFLSPDRNFLRAASPLYKVLGVEGQGFEEGRRKPFFRRVLPSPISHSLYPNYGSMKLKGPAWR